MALLALKETIARLEALYPKPRALLTADPYEAILLENVGYLVDDQRRADVWRAFVEKVGVDPDAILRTSPRRLAKVIEKGGMLPAHRAKKLRTCAEIAKKIGLGRLRTVVRTAPKEARPLLKRFPGIGDPGADKLLLFARRMVTLAPDSNALRVLVRLGWAKEDSDYGKTYRAVAAAVEPVLPRNPAWLLRAHRLLRLHGQVLCRRTAPACGDCPLAKDCKTGRLR